jgi:hypothetical protein
MDIDAEKLETAIAHLRAYQSTIDNLLYHKYSEEGLKKELQKIEDSIDYLQSLMPG